MRFWFSTLACVTAAWLGAAEARANDVFLFLDRSPAGRSEQAATHATTVAGAALRAGHRVRVFAQGQGRRGHVSHELNLKRDGSAFREPIDKFDAAFLRSPDPRAALRQAVLIKKDKPLWIVFVGPFDAGDDPIASEVNTLRLARQRWNRAAPQDSRVCEIGMTDAGRARLDEGEGPLRGRIANGYVVLSFDPLVVKPAPRPSFEEPKELKARAEMKVRWLPLGAPASYVHDAVRASSDLPDDVIVALTPRTSDLVLYALTRRAKDGRVATFKLERAPNPDVLWLATEQLQPVSFDWNAVHPAVRLVGDDDKDRKFAASVRAGVAATKTFRLRHVGLGSPEWDVTRKGDRLGDALRLAISEGTRSGDVTEHAVTVTYDGPPRTAYAWYTIKAKETPLSVGLAVEIQAAPIEPTAAKPPAKEAPATPPPQPTTTTTTNTLTLTRAVDFPDEVRLPMLSFGLGVDVAGPQNATGHVVVRAEPQALHDALVLEWTGTDDETVAVDAGTPIAVRAGDKFAWRAILKAGSAQASLGDGTLHIAVQGDEASGHRLPVRIRKPRFAVQEGDGAHYLVNEDGMTAANPLIVRLDPDGTTGAWLTSWIREGPTVDVDPKGIQAFAVQRANKPDTWHVLPVGPWRGRQPEIFDEQFATLQIRVNDAAGNTIGTHTLRVTISPRWGSRGWVLVGLAAFAALLGLATYWHLRPQPLIGTLLYTADGLNQTVGKLDLSRLGRKRSALKADASGRLSFSKGIAIARVLPTRMGGMIEIPRDGGTVEKRLLIDGISVRVGEHALRYVSGQAAAMISAAETHEGPDLLGADFDMPTGQVDDAYKQARDEFKS